ncbi:MAG: hypothetical protein Q9171_002217 [Xanthocarpia ochracea]
MFQVMGLADVTMMVRELFTYLILAYERPTLLLLNIRRHQSTLTESLQIDQSTMKDDLAQITDAPGPPTVQPGIPALQPSIPTSGVASLSIPPIYQTSSLKTSVPLVPSAKDAQPSTPASFSTNIDSKSAVSASIPRSASTTTTIPFLSELMSQLFSGSTNTLASSIYGPTFVPSSVASEPTSTGISSKPAANPPLGKASPFAGDPKDGVPPVSTPSMLTYSLSLPSYSKGFDTSAVVETLIRSSPPAAKDKPSPTVYSYSLLPYTPKIPTYVATSAGLAPLDMTSGAPGIPGGAAPTNRIFLQQGVVDLTKDPVTATSSMLPVYSPACLGNAYGGGYVITPTMYVANANATGVANIPPAYGFSYKLDPTQSPGYGGAVIIVDTKGPVPTVSSQLNPGLSSSSVVHSSSRATQSVGAITGTLPSKDAPTNMSKDLVPTPTRSRYGTSVSGNLSSPATSGHTQPSVALTGSPTAAKDEAVSFSEPSLSPKDGSAVNTKYHVPAYETPSGIPPFAKDGITISSAVSAPTPTRNTLSTALSSDGISTTLPMSTVPSGAYTDPSIPSKDILVTSLGEISPATASNPQNMNVAGNPVVSSRNGSSQPPETSSALPSPIKDASVINPNDPLPTPHDGPLGTIVLVSSLSKSGNGANGHTSVLATRVKSVIITTSTTWCPSTAPNLLSISPSVLGVVPLSTAVTGNGIWAGRNIDDKDAYMLNARITSSTALGAVIISMSTSTEVGSGVATVLPQDQLQRAAVAFESTVTDTYGTVYTKHFSSTINSTLILSGDGSETAPFQGKSARLTVSALMVSAGISFAWLMLNYL